MAGRVVHEAVRCSKSTAIGLVPSPGSHGQEDKSHAHKKVSLPLRSPDLTISVEMEVGCKARDPPDLAPKQAFTEPWDCSVVSKSNLELWSQVPVVNC